MNKEVRKALMIAHKEYKKMFRVGQRVTNANGDVGTVHTAPVLANYGTMMVVDFGDWMSVKRADEIKIAL